MTRLGRKFFSTDAQTLAQGLLGQRLVRILPNCTRLAGLIVETEAYLGEPDRASHAYGLRRTPRNEAMYRAPGTAYVYFTYGMHFCFNIVCGRVDDPLAVLIRALEPTEGLDAMRAARANGTKLRDTDLCSGPAKLCQALSIDRAQNGIDLVADATLFLERARRGRTIETTNTPRIGVGYAKEWAHKPLRWVIRGHPHASRARG